MTSWNLKEVFASDEAWNEELERLSKELEQVVDFKGKLTTLEGLTKYYEFEQKTSIAFDKLYPYVSMNYDKDQKNLNYQALKNKISVVIQKYMIDASFIDNEILSIKYEEYEKMAKESKIINENLFNIKKLFDTREHVLTPAEENIITNYSLVSGAFGQMYALLQNSDFTPIEATLTDGTKVYVSPNTYTSLLSNAKSQEDRKIIFEAQFGYYEKHKSTLAGIYKGVVDKNIANMKNRGYQSFLEAALDHNKIDENVYLSLINTVRENTKPLKRFIEFRKKYFNLKEYHTYDRFLSISNTETKYPYEKAYEDVLKALEPMGQDFVEHAKLAMAEGHVDVYPSEGKRSGAYSTSIYGYGPYILLNHADTLDSAFTLAHECGHSIHTLYSTENQPYATHGYQIFVAEIPSTFNERLFFDYLLKNSDSKDLKIQALEQQIDGIVSTFYRQTLFADYEYQAHKLVVDGKPFTYESLSNIMKDLYNTYYGIDLETEELKKFVWAYIPHLFYTPFYVYQYATCYSASQQIFNDIKAGKPGAKEAYINMLKAGGKDYPIEIVKISGVDLTSKEPFKAVCDKLDSLLDELEALLNE